MEMSLSSMLLRMNRRKSLPPHIGLHGGIDGPGGLEGHGITPKSQKRMLEPCETWERLPLVPSFSGRDRTSLLGTMISTPLMALPMEVYYHA